jgi:hypothetical protein
MGDRLLALLFVIVIEINYLHIWMRFQMEAKGKTYPIFNSWFMVYEDFLVEKHFDSKLRQKYRRTILTLMIISACLTIVVFVY